MEKLFLYWKITNNFHGTKNCQGDWRHFFESWVWVVFSYYNKERKKAFLSMKMHATKRCFSRTEIWVKVWQIVFKFFFRHKKHRLLNLPGQAGVTRSLRGKHVSVEGEHLLGQVITKSDREQTQFGNLSTAGAWVLGCLPACLPVHSNSPHPLRDAEEKT